MLGHVHDHAWALSSHDGLHAHEATRAEGGPSWQTPPPHSKKVGGQSQTPFSHVAGRGAPQLRSRQCVSRSVSPALHGAPIETVVVDASELPASTGDGAFALPQPHVHETPATNNSVLAREILMLRRVSKGRAAR